MTVGHFRDNPVATEVAGARQEHPCPVRGETRPMSAMYIDQFHRDLEDAWSRVTKFRRDDDGALPADELLVQLQAKMEELRVAEHEILLQYDELLQNHSLEDQQQWRYQTLFDTAPAAYVTTDVIGLITEVNGAAQHLFQRPAERLVGTPMSVLIDARRRREFRLIANHLAFRPGQSQLHLWVRTPPDEITEVWASVSTGVAATEEPELRWILQRIEPQRGLDMLVETVKDLTTLLATAGDIDDLLTTLCERAVEIVDAKASGVWLADGNGNLQAVAASDKSTELLELLEMEYAHGPCIDAFRTNSVIMIDNLDHHAETWPRFVRLARKQHLRSVLSVPLRVGSEAIGAFSLLHNRLIAFGDRDVQIAETLAGFAAFGIRSGRAMDRTQQKVVQLQHALNSRIVIEQAKGMLAAQADVSPSMAFEALRGYARSNSRKVHQICEEIINGSLPVSELDISHVHEKDIKHGR